MEYSNIYVRRIRSLCKDRHIAVNRLATMSDVKQSTLDNIVWGLTKNPRVKTLHKIAPAFNMTLAEFLDFDKLNDYSFEITELLKEQNMTNYQLHIKSGVPKSSIGNLVNYTYDSVKLCVIHEVCQGFGISITEFFNSPLFVEDNLEP